MKRELPQPVTAPLVGEPGLYQLQARLEVVVGPFRLVTPTGFITDGASIPRAVWWLIGHPMHGPYQAAAITHDWLYVSRPVSRVVCDALFCQVLREYGVTRWRVAAMYAAVRAFGWAVWRRQQKRLGRADWRPLTEKRKTEERKTEDGKRERRERTEGKQTACDRK